MTVTELQSMIPRDQKRGATDPLAEMIKGQKKRKARQVPAAEDCHNHNDSCGSMSPSPSQSRSTVLTSEPQQYQAQSMFMGLPLDITLCVFDYTEADGSIALSLACKGLYCHLFAKARTRFENASTEVKLKVQTFLEKGLRGNQIYCAFCRSFHSLFRADRQFSCQESKFPDSSFNIRKPGGRVWTLEYLDARAITNAGLFESPTARKTTRTPIGKDWRQPICTGSGWSQWLEFKVINQELLLRVKSQHIRNNAQKEGDEFNSHVACVSMSQSMPSTHEYGWIVQACRDRVAVPVGTTPPAPAPPASRITQYRLIGSSTKMRRLAGLFTHAGLSISCRGTAWVACARRTTRSGPGVRERLRSGGCLGIRVITIGLRIPPGAVLVFGRPLH